MSVSIVAKQWHLMLAGNEIQILPAVWNYACDHRKGTRIGITSINDLYSESELVGR